MADMTILDMLIAFVVLIGLWRGFQAGALKTAMSVVGYLVALIVASWWADDLSVLLLPYIDNPVLAVATAFLLVVLAVLLVLHVVLMTASGVLKALKLSFVDRVLGGVLGAAKGLIKVLILLSIASPVLVYLPNWQDSILAQNLLPFAPVATDLLKQILGDAWQQVQNPLAHL